MRNLKIGTRLILGFGAGVLITAVVSMFALFEMREMADLTTQMYRHPLTVSNAVRDIRADINAMHGSMQDVVFADDIEQIERAAAIVDEYDLKVHEDFDIVFEWFLGEMTDVEHARQMFSEWKDVRDEVIELSKQGRKNEAVEITRGKGAQHVDRMTADIQTMIDFASRKAESFLADVQAQERSIIILVSVLIIIMIVMGIIVSLLTTRSIVKPLGIIVDGIRDISQGHLEKEIDIYRKDEVGMLADSFRDLQNDLRKKVQLAERISAGDFGTDIPPSSEKDELGKSFYAMTTSLRTATAELRENEERYRTLFNDIADYILIFEQETHRILDFNQSFIQRYGYTPDELRAMTPYNFHFPSDFEKVEKNIDDKENLSPHTYTHITKKGESFPVEVHTGEIEYKGKEAWISIIRDITERKKAEEALQELSKEQQIIFDSVPAAIWYKDTENRILRVNRAGAESVGMHSDDIIGKTAWELFPDEADHYYEDDKEVIKSGKPKLGIVERLQTSSGEKLWVHTDKVPFRDEQGTITGIIVFVVDITDRKEAEEELRESEKKYRGLVDNALVGVYKTTVKGEIIYANEYLLKMLEFKSLDELRSFGLGKAYKNYDDRKEMINKVRKTGKVDSFEVDIITKTGKTICVLLSAVLEGKFLSGMIMDITESKKAQKKLQRSEEKYRRLVENLKERYFFYTHDTEGVFTYISPSITTILGYSQEDYLIHYSEYFTGSPVNEAAKHHTDLSIQGKMQPPYEVEVFHKNKSIHRLEVSEVPIFDDDGNIIAVEGIAHDITERKKAEEEILEWKNRYESAVSASGHILYDWNSETNDVTYGGAFEDILGYTDDEMSGGLPRWVDMIHPDDRAYFSKTIEHLNASKNPAHLEYRVRRKDGKYIYVEDSGQFIKEEHDIIRRMIGFVKDISERKMAENELREFVYTVSHDLKAPLRKLDAFSDLLISKYRSKLDGQSLHFLDRIKYNTEHMKKLIDDLLELSRIGSIKAVKQKTELSKIINESMKEFESLISERNVKITISNDFPKIRCDRVRMLQVFSNLIGNALKFSKAKVSPKITIGCKELNNYYQIFIKDNGIGIEGQYFEKIFGIFQRLNKSEEYEGTGIGLTIVKKIIENMNGRIWIKSELGKGSTFYFTIPKT